MCLTILMKFKYAFILCLSALARDTAIFYHGFLHIRTSGFLKPSFKMGDDAFLNITVSWDHTMTLRNCGWLDVLNVWYHSCILVLMRRIKLDLMDATSSGCPSNHTTGHGLKFTPVYKYMCIDHIYCEAGDGHVPVCITWESRFRFPSDKSHHHRSSCDMSLISQYAISVIDMCLVLWVLSSQWGYLLW